MLCSAKYFTLESAYSSGSNEPPLARQTQTDPGCPAPIGAECHIPLTCLHLPSIMWLPNSTVLTTNLRLVREEFGLHNISRRLGAVFRAALVGSSLLTAPSAAAQMLPQLPPGMTTDDAIRLFRTSPEFRDFVRMQLLSTGLTPAQMRNQLVAAGYPANLLDAFLAAEGLGSQQNEEELLGAMSALGVRSATGPPVEAGGDSSVGGPPRVPEARETAPAGLPLFGLDVFHGDPAAFEGLITGPVDGSYRLGAGDQLVLILTGAVEISHELEVTRQGFIVIPRVGRVFVNSLTLDQLRQVLFDRLGERYSGITRSLDAPTKFDIVVAQVRAQSVRVVGEVAKPGTYQIPAAGGVMSALYRAGGITERGSFRAVQVKRGTELLAEIDVYDYLLRGVIESAVALQPGDLIFVPVHGPHVKIAGEVFRGPCPACGPIRQVLEGIVADGSPE